MDTSFNLWLIPALPLAGCAINGLFGRRYSNKAVTAVALLGSGAAFLWALVVAARFSSLPESAIPHVETYATWLRAGNFSVPYAFMVDQLTLVMLLVVTGVGFLIHIYSAGYMAQEGGYYRFFSYLNLFMFFMLVLVLANNYLLMFVGWEGVGLASYLLIGFFFLRDSAASAGKKAFIVNRIGDFGFLIALFLLIKHFHTLTFAEVFKQVSAMPTGHNISLLTTVGMLLMVGACGKSAQIPLYVWLPDAMEGPTPVSALIHAATMVTAGVYMVTRSNPIFLHAPDALLMVAVIGSLTAIFAATIGITQNDIKRVLAYSTVSQLGYMFMACGVAAFSAGIFHLMTHAFFKALLFLGAGSVIHALGGEQDMRAMGGLRKYIPCTFWVMTAATFAIAGFFPLAGFFSKDEILWRALTSEHGSVWFWLIGILTAFITSFYMFRLWFMTFFGEYRGTAPSGAEQAGDGHQVPIGGHDTVAPAPAAGSHGHDQHGHGTPHESPWVMLAPLVVLAILSVVGGWIGWPAALGGSNHFEHFLAPVVSIHAEEAAAEAEPSKELLFAVISLLVAFAGLFFAWLFYHKRRDLPEKASAWLGMVYRLVRDKYRIDELYAALFVNPLINGSAKLLWRGVDVGAIDGTINASARGAQEVAGSVRQMQSGNIRSYAGWVALGAVVIVIYMIVAGAK
jgi:NADH-quinone oxidoreductase subunit L